MCWEEGVVVVGRRNRESREDEEEHTGKFDRSYEYGASFTCMIYEELWRIYFES